MSGWTLRISSVAAAEIVEAAAWIEAESSPAAAARWLDGLDTFLQSLLEMPERFPVASEDRHFTSGTLRRALYHQHRVLFTVDGDMLCVLHVRHGMRDELTHI